MCSVKLREQLRAVQGSTVFTVLLCALHIHILVFITVIAVRSSVLNKGHSAVLNTIHHPSAVFNTLHHRYEVLNILHHTIEE